MHMKNARGYNFLNLIGDGIVNVSSSFIGQVYTHQHLYVSEFSLGNRNTLFGGLTTTSSSAEKCICRLYLKPFYPYWLLGYHPTFIYDGHFPRIHNIHNVRKTFIIHAFFDWLSILSSSYYGNWKLAKIHIMYLFFHIIHYFNVQSDIYITQLYGVPYLLNCPFCNILRLIDHRWRTFSYCWTWQ